MPSTRLRLPRFWLPAAGSAALAGALLGVVGSGSLPAIGQSQGSGPAIGGGGDRNARAGRRVRLAGGGPGSAP